MNTCLTGRIEKRDINLDYQTYGDGDVYAIDGNDYYQPSDYDELEDRTRHSRPPQGMNDLICMMLKIKPKFPAPSKEVDKDV